MSNTLQHHGVLGMKWGVRKDRSSSSHKVSEDHTTSRSLQKKHVSELSSNELKTLTNRLQLEKQYKDLNPDDLSKGLAVLKKITSTGMTLATLYGVTKTPLARDLIKVLKKT